MCLEILTVFSTTSGVMLSDTCPFGLRCDAAERVETGPIRRIDEKRLDTRENLLAFEAVG